MKLFHNSQDYTAVQQLLFEVRAAINVRLLSYCIMPNHWHLILWPRNSTEMSHFLQTFTGTHAQRWRTAHSSTGCGAVYQGRYKAFPIQSGDYFLNACRYVERNPVRANLVHRAEEWRWSSCWLHQHEPSDKAMHPWPIPRPDNWLSLVNKTENSTELHDIRCAVSRGLPLGDSKWVAETAKAMGIESHLRRPGRPPKSRSGNPSRPLFGLTPT